jgi:hypothetical protein
MMKTHLLIPLITTLQMTGAMALTPGYFPSVSGKNLNNKSWTAPANFPGERTLVVVGFEEEQQVGIDSWLEGMNARDPASKISWIEMPLINNPGLVMRWIINTGMRGGIPSKEVRSHVWTAYTNKNEFMKACGMTSTKDVYALVVDRSGNILAMESGNYSRKGAQILFKVLER